MFWCRRTAEEEETEMRKTGATRFGLLTLTIVTATLPAGPSAFAQPTSADIVIGKRVTLPSKVLGREMPLSIYFPAGYETSGVKYPVLYDLNAFAYFTYCAGTVELLARNMEMPEMIVVGLPSLQSGYVPTPYEERGAEPTAADLSLKFFKDELMPFVEANYRTAGFNVLSGHSVAGLFTVYALSTQPGLFSAGIASSPWFQANDQYWLKHIDRMFQAKSLADTYLFTTVGRQERDLTISTYTALEKWMKSKDLKGLTWKSQWFDNVDHSSMLGKSLYDGLLCIFEGWKIPFDVLLSGDTSAIEKHAATMKARFGGRLDYDIPENLLNQVGYQLLGRESYDQAINILTLNMRLHPDSPNTYDSLAEAFLTKGDRETAKKYYKLAIEKNPGKTNFEQHLLQSSLEKLKELER
jgi:predicted alpha/beta superfamily hydrolase